MPKHVRPLFPRRAVAFVVVAIAADVRQAEHVAELVLDWRLGQVLRCAVSSTSNVPVRPPTELVLNDVV